MNESCPGCMRLENLVSKLRKDLSTANAKLRQAPLQEIKNLRAEIQDARNVMDSVLGVVNQINSLVRKK